MHLLSPESLNCFQPVHLINVNSLFTSDTCPWEPF